MSMSFKGAAVAIGLAVASLSAAPQAMAALLFDLSPTNITTGRAANSGPGQGVDVAKNVKITDIAFFANLPNGGDAKYLIFNGDNTTLLFSTTKSFPASSIPTFIHSGPISFNLAAGNRYFFGIIADNNIDVGGIFPVESFSENGLTAVTTGNSNYANFANPTSIGNGAAEFGLQLSGPAGVVPEPATWGLLLAGFFGLGVMLRLRKKIQSTAIAA